MEEIWKDIEGFESFYQVSNSGRVKTLYYNHSKNKNERMLKLCTDQKGYLQVCLHNCSIHKSLRVARLVAQAFIPNPENKPQINHIDGDKLNNCVKNLEWCTCKENIQHSFKNGLNKILIGDRSPNHKLTKFQVKEIRKKYERNRNKTLKEIGREYNISDRNVLSILNYETWKDYV